MNTTQAGYSKVAAQYAKEFFNELDNKPLDRQLLNRFARQMKGKGDVCDIGCGPGQITRYLRDRGVENIFGIDLSPGMVSQAKRLNADIDFYQGNMSALDMAAESLAGIVAFYSLIHIPNEEVVSVLQEFKRVLQPGGLLFFSFHMGQETVHVDNWWDEAVSIDFFFFEPDEMKEYLERAGFKIEDLIMRYPYEGVEHPSRRSYIFATKP